MEELLKYLGFTTPFIYAAAAYGFFYWLDENASDEARAALARTMRLKDYKSEHVASALVEVFDRIYTYPLLRWRAFRRSVLYTTIVTVIWLFEYFHFFRFGWRDISSSTSFWFITVWLFNVLTDYLSLFLIRRVLIRSGTKPVTGLALGAVSGVAIVFAAFCLRILFLIPLFGSISISDLIGAFIYTYSATLIVMAPALIVFVWLPLFALGIVIARLLTPLSWIVGRAQWLLKGGGRASVKGNWLRSSYCCLP